MRKIISILAVLNLFYFSVSKEIRLSQDVEKNLNIKTISVKREVISADEEFPGLVIEDPKNSYIVSSVVDGVLEKLLIKKGTL